MAESTQLHDSVAVALHPGQQSVSVARLIGVSGESTGLVPTNELSIQHSFTLPSRRSFISLDASRGCHYTRGGRERGVLFFRAASLTIDSISWGNDYIYIYICIYVYDGTKLNNDSEGLDGSSNFIAIF